MPERYPECRGEGICEDGYRVEKLSGNRARLSAAMPEKTIGIWPAKLNSEIPELRAIWLELVHERCGDDFRVSEYRERSMICTHGCNPYAEVAGVVSCED